MPYGAFSAMEKSIQQANAIFTGVAMTGYNDISDRIYRYGDSLHDTLSVR
jgi:hypothetical protein